MPEIVISIPPDLESVGQRWRELQQRADASFFQTWNWVGCLARERYPRPVLLEARSQGATVGLALFNRQVDWLSDSLCLGETGTAEWDAVFVEHNGPLIARGQDRDLLATCLKACLNSPIAGRRQGRRVILSGVGDHMVSAAREISAAIRARQASRPAPYYDFHAAETGSPDATVPGHLAGLSANARYQIRRSDRRYREIGPLRIERADTSHQAHDFLDALAALHQATWTARGRPGAFANPQFARFHHALIDRAMTDGHIDLLRISAGDQTIGFLYNFRYRNRVYAYQSGFDYQVSHPHQKPGLTCHHLAIEMCQCQGVEIYDFLAGAARYKTSLANASVDLHWIEMTRRRSLRSWVDYAGSLSRIGVNTENAGSRPDSRPE